MLGLSWATLGPPWRPYGPSWRRVGPSVAHRGGTLAHYKPSWPHLGAILGLLWAFSAAPGLPKMLILFSSLLQLLQLSLLL